jgi:hypothetical protein
VAPIQSRRDHSLCCDVDQEHDRSSLIHKQSTTKKTRLRAPIVLSKGSCCCRTMSFCFRVITAMCIVHPSSSKFVIHLLGSRIYADDVTAHRVVDGITYVPGLPRTRTVGYVLTRLLQFGLVEWSSRDWIVLRTP